MHPIVEEKEYAENVVFINRKEAEAKEESNPDTQVHEPDIFTYSSQSKSNHRLHHHHPK